MEEPQTQSVEFNVELPKPKPRGLIAKVLAGIGLLAVVGVVAAVVLSRTAAPVVDPTVKVLPTEMMMMATFNTHTDQLPNFNAITEAWAGSKEANQIKSALQLAVMQTGFNWEEDIKPWLGERVTVGLGDLGNYLELNDTDTPRGPKLFIVAQTIDRAKSDAFLANVRKEIERNIKPSDYYTQTLHDDVYRGIPIVYLTSETNWGGAKPMITEMYAYATINDVLVVTTQSADLHSAIDAALDGKNLSLNANYQTVMNSLPGQNAFAMYVDFNRYMQSVMDLTLGVSSTTSQVFDNIATNVYSNTNATPDPAFLQQQAERQRKQEEAQRKQQEQMQKLKENLQAIGGMGVAMTYEPTGIRFDTTMQFNPANLPEAQRQLYETSFKVAANKIYESIPALTMAMLNGNNPATYLKPFIDPNQPDPFANMPGMQDGTFRDKLAEVEKLAGIKFNTDLVDLLNGEFAFIMLPKAQTVSDDPTAKSSPFEFALVLESSDAARVAATLDKLAQTFATESNGSVAWQSLSGLPYSVITLDGEPTPALTYGVVDGRLVIGSTSETLLAIQNAKQTPLSGDATFKAATGLLPSNRVQTGYLNLQPLWTVIDSQAKDDVNAVAVLNYLGHFKWLSLSSGAPDNNLIRAEMHIGVGK